MLIASSLLALVIGVGLVAAVAVIAIGLLWLTHWAEELCERFLG